MRVDYLEKAISSKKTCFAELLILAGAGNTVHCKKALQDSLAVLDSVIYYEEYRIERE